MLTTIQVKKETADRLKRFKQHPRQSYDETINELMNDNEVEVLTMEDIEELKLALEEVKQGKTKTIQEVAKELGVTLRDVWVGILTSGRKISEETTLATARQYFEQDILHTQETLLFLEETPSVQVLAVKNRKVSSDSRCCCERKNDLCSENTKEE